MGIHLYVDRDDLLSGQYWEPVLQKIITTSDVFQLYWSQAAADSSAVENDAYYDFENANYELLNTVLSQHPFNNDLVVAESDSNVCFTDSVDVVWDKFVASLNNAFAEQ